MNPQDRPARRFDEPPAYEDLELRPEWRVRDNEGPHDYRVRICVPEDHAPDGTIARWTADATAPVGYPYTYSTIGVSVYVDFESPRDPEIARHSHLGAIVIVAAIVGLALIAVALFVRGAS
jgi:hypothetical protein